ncbi:MULTISPECIES: hypothetical protein [unclassified Mesorhizobium]|uniref:hypothetical protein n=1 Tax=unclassified Mesorhizobium TaxID=325217 RepID=UPI0003CE6FDA|nr:hypothetical protein [Mesorhizobium sp. LNHC229A00]ESY84438.1 hypothetical protein X741_33985 [Mesorhizobium sp. LNHC229A00]
MKQFLRSGAAKAAQLANIHSKEIKLATSGAVVGGVAGMSIGGVGVVGMGGATGFGFLTVALILAAAGALVGSRIGVWLDQKG